VKIQREGQSPIIIGVRVTLGQLVMSVVNGAIFWYNWVHPEAKLPGEVVGMIAQPIIFFLQVWWANRYGVTTEESE
jgi:hypothetical protein